MFAHLFDLRHKIHMRITSQKRHTSKMLFDDLLSLQKLDTNVVGSAYEGDFHAGANGARLDAELGSKLFQLGGGFVEVVDTQAEVIEAKVRIDGRAGDVVVFANARDEYSKAVDVQIKPHLSIGLRRLDDLCSEHFVVVSRSCFGVAASQVDVIVCVRAQVCSPYSVVWL